MSDSLPTRALSSVEGYAQEDGGFLLPPFWDSAMARYGLKTIPWGSGSVCGVWIGLGDNVELLMRHMMREPLLQVADRVLRALVTEGEHRVLPAIAEEPQNRRSPEWKKWKRSKEAHEFTEAWVNGLQRPLRRVCWNLMESVAFGHKLCEVELDLVDGSVVPIDLPPKPRTSYQIKVDKSNRVLGVKPSDSKGEERLVPPAQLLLMSVGGMDDSPTGEPALATAYKPWQRKEADLKNQGMSSRQAGGGFLSVTQDMPAANTTYTGLVKVRDKDGVTIVDAPASEVGAKAAAQARTGTAAVFAPGQRPAFLQTNGSAVFDPAIDRSDREMVMCFLGQARQILSSDSNSQADSGEAAGVAATMRDLYRGLLCDCIKGLFKTYLILNKGEAYADVVPSYDIFTEESKDLAAVGTFLSGNFDRLTRDQLNVLASWIGLPEFPEDIEELAAIDAEEQAKTDQEVARFTASFGENVTFSTRLEIQNGAAQKKVNGAARSADRQFRALVKRLAEGKIDQERFESAFAHTLQVAHDRAYSFGLKHSGAAERLSEAAETYIAETVAKEADFARGLAEELLNGTRTQAQATAHARQYAQRIRGTANVAFAEGSIGSGETLTWTLGGNEDHCVSCPQLANLSPFEPDQLFQVPGDAQTECRSNCLCKLVRSDGKHGFGPVSFA